MALAAGIGPCLPGFAAAIGLIEPQPDGTAAIWIRLYDYAWFVSFGTASVSYVVLMKLLPPAATGTAVAGTVAITRP